MDLQAQILLRHDKQNMLMIRDYVGGDKQRFARLMELFFSDRYRIQQRASWAVMHCVIRQPSLIDPYLEKMIRLLDKPVHDAVKRNITRILRDIEIPEALHGLAFDHCFRLLQDAASPVAIKAFSMYTLAKIVRTEPELANELRLAIEAHLPYESGAYQVAARKVFQQLASGSLYRL